MRLFKFEGYVVKFYILLFVFEEDISCIEHVTVHWVLLLKILRRYNLAIKIRFDNEWTIVRVRKGVLNDVGSALKIKIAHNLVYVNSEVPSLTRSHSRNGVVLTAGHYRNVYIKVFRVVCKHLSVLGVFHRWARNCECYVGGAPGIVIVLALTRRFRSIFETVEFKFKRASFHCYYNCLFGVVLIFVR